MMNSSKGSNKNSSNIADDILLEEHFVTPDLIKKDSKAVFIEDNPQKALEILMNLDKNQNPQEKLQYIKHLAELLGIIGEKGIFRLKEVTAFIETTVDEIKLAFLTQIASIISLLQKHGDEGYMEIVHVILPTISSLSNSENYDIKEAAGGELAKIAPVLHENDRAKHLLTRVLTMAHDDTNEDNRIISVRLLSQMATLFGKDLCEQFVGSQLLALGEDPKIRVRKEVVKNLYHVGKIVSPLFFKQKLLPFYFRLCQESHWDIKRACVDIIFEISNLCNGDIAKFKENELTNIMLTFLQDMNRWVKISAYKILGEFITTLQGVKVNEKLMEHYLQMPTPNVNNLTTENDIIYACSYNFPAVLLTLGPDKWPILNKLFHTLLRGNDKVRRPLACSLHHIAKIIGEDNAEKDLIKVFENFLKDSNDEIIYHVVENLALFIKVFRGKRREHMIDIILNLQKDKRWRVREMLAKQIDKLVLLFSAESNFKIIAPICFKLAKDPVAGVRQEAAQNVYYILKALLKSDELYKNSIIENIKGFSIANKFTIRQTFAAMCGKIMIEPELFETYFFDSLIPLAYDKVPNVRIAIAKILQKIYQEKNVKLCENLAIIQIVRKFKTDISRDVRALVEGIELKEEVKETEELKEEPQNTEAKAQEQEKNGNVETKLSGEITPQQQVETEVVQKVEESSAVEAQVKQEEQQGTEIQVAAGSQNNTVNN